MLSSDQFTKYSKLLDDILGFKPIAPKVNITHSSTGSVTDSTRLLQFLKVNTEDPILKGKCDEVYKIINPDTPVATAPAAPVATAVPAAGPATS